METIRTITIAYIFYSGKAFKVIIHAFDINHGLIISVYSESLFLNTLTNHIYHVKRPDFLHQRIISTESLTYRRSQFYLRVKRSKECSHEVTEAIKHTQHHHHSGSGHCNSYHRDKRDDIYYICSFLREQITSGYKEGSRYHINSLRNIPCKVTK